MADEKMSVDDLMKPENEAQLSEALDQEFKESTEEKPEDSGTSDQKKDTSDQAPEGDKQKASEGDQKPDQTSNQTNDEAGNKKEDRYSELLKDRNEAKDQAAKDSGEKDELLSRISELEKKVADKDGKTGEDDESFTDDQKDGVSSSQVEDIVKKALSERDEATGAEKSIADGVKALSEKKGIEHAADFTKEISGIMAKHSSMSAYAAYRMLQGEGIIPSDNEASANSNANRMGTGSRSNSGLRNSKRPEDMTTAELDAAVEKDFGKGGKYEGQI